MITIKITCDSCGENIETTPVDYSRTIVDAIGSVEYFRHGDDELCEGCHWPLANPSQVIPL